MVLALTCMYLMWFIIYMAQLHPIVSEYPSFDLYSPLLKRMLIRDLSAAVNATTTEPKRGDVRFLEH